MDIKIGINEFFKESLNYFAQSLDLKMPNRVESKRITIKRPNANELSESIKNEILKNNALDLELYNYALNKFKNLEIKQKQKINITGDKYDYAKTYTNRFSLFEVSLRNKVFLENNKIFFQQLSQELNKNKNLSSKEFVDVYVMSTFKTLKNHFPKKSFETIENSFQNKEALKKLDILSNFIDNNKEFTSKILKFDFNIIEIRKPKSFFSKFFNKL